MRVNVNTSVQFCFAGGLRKHHGFRKTGAAAHRSKARRSGLGTVPGERALLRACMVVDFVNVGEGCIGATMGRVLVAAVGRELADAR
jgi:hypothetical protein